MNDHITRAELLAALRAERLRMAEACDAVAANPLHSPHLAMVRLAAELRREPVATCGAVTSFAEGMFVEGCGNPIPCPLHPAPKPLHPEDAHKVLSAEESGYPDQAPVPRGHCGRCDRCGWPADDDVSKGCTPGNCSMRNPVPPPRTHCAGCGAPYQADLTERLVAAEVALSAGPGGLDENEWSKAPGPPRPAQWTADDVAAIVEDEMRQPPDPTRVVTPSPRAEPTGAPIEYGPEPHPRAHMGGDFGIAHRVNKWPALHASEAALRAEVEMVRANAAGLVRDNDKLLNEIDCAEQERDALRAARDRALAVLDDRETLVMMGAFGYARVREALKL